MIVENASLRRSGRQAKGTGTLERMQAISTQITQHSTRKHKDAPLDDIPAMTQDNPMAPQPPRSRAKKKKVGSLILIFTSFDNTFLGKTSGNEIPPSDRGVPQLPQMPTPVQVAYIVPPGTEPSLTGKRYAFGCQFPQAPGSTAPTSTSMQSTQQSSLGLGESQQLGHPTAMQSTRQSSQGLGRSQQFGHHAGSPTTSMQSTQQPLPALGPSQQSQYQLPANLFATPTRMQGAQQSLPKSGRNRQPEFQFPPEQFDSINHDRYVHLFTSTMSAIIDNLGGRQLSGSRRRLLGRLCKVSAVHVHSPWTCTSCGFVLTVHLSSTALRQHPDNKSISLC